MDVPLVRGLTGSSLVLHIPLFDGILRLCAYFTATRELPTAVGYTRVCWLPLSETIHTYSEFQVPPTFGRNMRSSRSDSTAACSAAPPSALDFQQRWFPVCWNTSRTHPTSHSCIRSIFFNGVPRTRRSARAPSPLKAGITLYASYIILELFICITEICVRVSFFQPSAGRTPTPP